MSASFFDRMRAGWAVSPQVMAKLRGWKRPNDVIGYMFQPGKRAVVWRKGKKRRQ